MGYVLSVAAGALAVALWAYLLGARGGFWRAQKAVLPEAQPSFSGAVAAIVPARNEAETIAAALASLLAQRDGRIHVFLVDDGSTDGTAQIARDTARGANAEAVTILAGRPLPQGWSGKLWAIEQGIARARELRPQFLLLTDADVVHAPGSVAALAAFVDEGGYDLASLLVRLHCESAAERLLIPAFVFFFFKLYPPTWIADPRRATAGAAGGCLLIRPEALERAGGIAAIRDQIIDDCALARAVKRRGGKVWLGLTDSAASIRPYGSLAAIGRMIARSAFNQLRHSALLLAGALLGLALTYVAPVALLFSGRVLPIALGAAAWALMTAGYVPMVRFYRLNPLWALALPLAALFYAGAMVKSALDFWSGRGGQWKGRAQDRAAGAP
jgi:hopene-associated glycosyltransferase HpnB